MSNQQAKNFEAYILNIKAGRKHFGSTEATTRGLISHAFLFNS